MHRFRAANQNSLFGELIDLELLAVRGSWRKKYGLVQLISISRPRVVLPKFSLLQLRTLLLISHTERKASAAICLTLGFCARGQDSARDTPMSNPGLIPTTIEKCTYLNLVLNFAPIQLEAIVERILTSRAVAVSEFKRAPNEIVAEAKGEPIAVLTNNKPSFYVMPASTYESLMEAIYDIESAPLLEKRLADYKAGKEKVIKVQLDSKKS